MFVGRLLVSLWDFSNYFTNLHSTRLLVVAHELWMDQSMSEWIRAGEWQAMAQFYYYRHENTIPHLMGIVPKWGRRAWSECVQRMLGYNILLVMLVRNGYNDIIRWHNACSAIRDYKMEAAVLSGTEKYQKSTGWKYKLGWNRWKLLIYFNKVKCQ